MTVQIEESDWKIFRKLYAEVLDRYCQNVLAELNRTIAKCERDYHKCYLKVWDILRKRDRELEELFEQPKRSNALFLLARMRGSGLLTEEEFSRFSKLTQQRIELILR